MISWCLRLKPRLAANRRSLAASKAFPRRPKSRSSQRRLSVGRPCSSCHPKEAAGSDILGRRESLTLITPERRQCEHGKVLALDQSKPDRGLACLSHATRVSGFTVQRCRSARRGCNVSADRWVRLGRLEHARVSAKIGGVPRRARGRGNLAPEPFGHPIVDSRGPRRLRQGLRATTPVANRKQAARIGAAIGDGRSIESTILAFTVVLQTLHA